ncbi:MAG: hypothetical protein H7835_04160 [Magnetococcus sp. XQGC-1]
MDLFGQQQSSVIQQEGAAFPTHSSGEGMEADADFFAMEEVAVQSEPLPAESADHTLALLEARLSRLTRLVSDLSAKNGTLRKMVADRDEYIDLLEQENATLAEQVERFADAQSQVIDGLSDILDRFAGGGSVLMAEEMVDFSDTRLLDETIGTA